MAPADPAETLAAKGTNAVRPATRLGLVNCPIARIDVRLTGRPSLAAAPQVLLEQAPLLEAVEAICRAVETHPEDLWAQANASAVADPGQGAVMLMVGVGYSARVLALVVEGLSVLELNLGLMTLTAAGGPLELRS